MTVARISLTQLGYISEAVSRFSSVFRSQFSRGVFKKQLYEAVVKKSVRREFLDRRQTQKV
jgi:hypothetical protein